MAEPTYLLMTEDTALTESRVLTTDPFTSNIQLFDSGPTNALTIETVLNLGSLAAISTPGLTTYIGNDEFASRGITSSGSINVTDGSGTTGNIILDVADSTSTQKVNVEANNINAGPAQSTLNFIAGANTGISASVNGSQYEITISSTGGGGGGGGTVTSVGAQCNFDGITFSGVPITTAGSIGLELPTAGTALNKVLGITDISPLTVGWVAGGGGGGIVENAQGISVGSTANLPSSSTTPSFIFGKNSGNSSASGIGANIGIGMDVLQDLTNGAFNVGIGSPSLQNLTTGQDNVAMGYLSLNALTTGAGNIGIGGSALKSLVGASGNIGIGGAATQNLTTGANNTVIGYESAQALVDGSNNVLLGAAITVTNPNDTNTVAIGFGVKTLGSNRVVLGNGITEKFVVGAEYGDGASVNFGGLATGGVMFPNVVTIPNPVSAGVQIYNTNNNEMQYYNGTSWIPMGGGGVSSVNVLVHSTPGNFVYTPTVGMKFVCVEMVGGGGSGESPGALTNNASTGGGGGGYCRRMFMASELGATEDFTVGSGGAAVNNAAGNAGTPSTFGTTLIMIASGGGGGQPALLPGAGGTSIGGNLNIKGSPGAFSYNVTAGGTAIIVLPAGGNSYLSCNNDVQFVPNLTLLAGKAGVSYGGGGGGSYAGSGNPTQLSGAGADGAVIITEYI